MSRGEEEEEEAIRLGSLRAKYMAQKEGGPLPEDGPAARREQQGIDMQGKEEVQRRLSQHLVKQKLSHHLARRHSSSSNR